MLGFSIFLPLDSHHWVCLTMPTVVNTEKTRRKMKEKERERQKGKGSNKTEQKIQKQKQVKQNGEQVNKNKNAYGCCSKYSSLILIIMGLGILFCHREVA